MTHAFTFQDFADTDDTKETGDNEDSRKIEIPWEKHALIKEPH